MKGLFYPLLISLLVLGSCATAIAFDESLQENEYALIYYKTVLQISEYNGIAVNWKAPGIGFSTLELKIPGGNTRFVFNGTVGTSNMGYTTYRDVPFVYNFENGKEYTFIVNQSTISIYDGKSMSSKSHIVTFSMYNGQTITYEYGKKVTH